MIATVASELGRNILHPGAAGATLVTWFECYRSRWRVEIKAIDQDQDSTIPKPLSRIITPLAEPRARPAARRRSWTHLRSSPNLAGAIVTAKKWVKPRGK
jgi:hypothetical protein